MGGPAFFGPAPRRLPPGGARRAGRHRGPWLREAFNLRATRRFLRGTAFASFGRTHARRAERRLIADYEGRLDEIAAALSPGEARRRGSTARERPTPLARCVPLCRGAGGESGANS
ncbi:MAG: DUF6537 domain-containing protein [Alphaproteobacteria bacterium]